MVPDRKMNSGERCYSFLFVYLSLSCTQIFDLVLQDNVFNVLDELTKSIETTNTSDGHNDHNQTILE